MNSTRSLTRSRATLFAEHLAAGERHRRVLASAWPAAALVALLLLVPSSGLAFLALVGAAIGYVLVRSGFGFASGYRRFFLHGDARPVQAQLLLLAVATLLFAPAFAGGELFGHVVAPTVMPLGLPLAAGALIFGVGMQLAGVCGSGTLTALGGGNGRMLVVLLFFVIGSFAASLDVAWWDQFPTVAGVALGESWGWGWGALVQLLLIAVIAIAVRGRRIAPVTESAPKAVGETASSASPGDWPMYVASVAIPVLGLLTLWAAGHQWTITWAYTLAGGKVAAAFGWVPSLGSFWSQDFPASALSGSALGDVTTVMDTAIVAGAALSAVAAGKWSLRFDLRPREIAMGAASGLLMGYGSRIAFGCNIGAFLAGVASTSLHGWGWIACAIPGNLLGMRLRAHLERDTSNEVSR